MSRKVIRSRGRRVDLMAAGIGVGLLLLFGTVSAGLAQEKAATAEPVFNEREAAAPAVKKADEGWWAESMKTKDQRLEWWREARWGCFMHWGVYAQLAGEWQGQPVMGYAEHIQRMRKIDQATYRKEAVEKFNPTKFNADEWAALLKRAGMRYLIITAKHHDGFAMFASDVSKYNIVDATPFRRDPMAELRAACQRAGIKFGFYYSQAFDWGEKDGAGNDWEYKNPGGDDLIGGSNWWETIPQEFPRIRDNYVNAKSIPQIRELLTKYHPDILWFDTSGKIPFSENLRILEEIRKIDPNVVVNGRLARGFGGRNFGDYINTGDRALEFATVGGDWEAIPTTNESYGYHKHDMSHKDPAVLIRLLPKAVSKNGNILLNVGPMGTGEIDPKDVHILEAIGDWMKYNSESIYGCGLTDLPIQSWGTSTRKGNTLYLHVFNWPGDGKLIVGGLKTPPTEAEIITPDGLKKANGAQSVNDKDIMIDVGKQAPFAASSVIKLSFAGPFQTDPVRLVSGVIPTQLLTFDAKRASGMGTGDGKKLRNYVTGFGGPERTLTWTVRVNQPTTFDVTASYVAGQGGGRGRRGGGGAAAAGATPAPRRYQIQSGDQKLVKEVSRAAAAAAAQVDQVGKLTLDAGVHTIVMSAPDATGGAPMMPLDIVLTPQSKS